MNLFGEFTRALNLDNPEFEKAGKVHDWRNYVPYEWQKHWAKFTERERQIIATMAETQADREEWE